MTPAARLQAAAEILDLIAGTRHPVEAVLKDWGRANRFAGAKDRRAIADRVYQCLRGRDRLAWLMGGATGRKLIIGALALQDGLGIEALEALYSGEGYGPAPLTSAERARLTAADAEMPQWLSAGLPKFVQARFKDTYGEAWLDEAQALMQPRAPIDLRVQGSRDELISALKMLGYNVIKTYYSSLGLRLPSEPPPNIRALPAFGQGRLEIQDEGSQIAAALTGVQPGRKVIDYCAGGGGKTMAMLQATDGKLELIACDIDQTRLNNIRPRLNRAGYEAQLRCLGAEGEGVEDLQGWADCVVVDAPCSGSGVWRRRPETAHRLTEDEVVRLHGLQVAILDRAARLVKDGGRLTYITCSLLTDENEASVAAFEAAHPEFIPFAIHQALENAPITPEGRDQLASRASGSCGHYLRLSPHSTATDGFFVALYEKKDRLHDS